MSQVRRLVLSETSGYHFRTDWYCLPPPPQFAFQVTEGHWTAEGDVSVREIYAWALVPAERALPKQWPVSAHVALRVVPAS